MKPRRILLVETNEDGTTGGSHRALADLVRGLDRTRFAPVVLLYQHNAVEPELTHAEVHVWDAIRARERAFRGPIGLARQVRGLLPAIVRRARFLRRAGIDLVHINNTPALGFEDWLPAARLVGVPCVAHARGEFWLTRRWLGRAVMRRFDRLLPVSHLMADFARAAGFPEERICTVHDGIDREAFLSRVRRPGEAVRAELGVPAGATVGIQVAHLRSWKGQDLVVEAMSRLPRATLERFVMWFVGSAPSTDLRWAEELRVRAAAAGLGDRVRFLGARTDVPDLLQAADFLVHASTAPEPFGLVLLEAMVLGRPVLASNLGGPVEILTPDCGITFDPRSPDDLAAELTRWVADPDLRRSLGQGGKRRAEAFDVRRTVKRIEAVYAELLP